MAHALNSNVRLTDTLERDLLRNALSDRPLILSAIAAGAARRTWKAITATADFFAEVNDSMVRARQQSARYSGSDW
jgi:hypothetical protein